MTGNARALRVLAITSRRRPMHGYAAPLCSLSIVCVFAQVAMSRVDAPAEGLDPLFVRRVGYPHAICKAGKTAPSLFARTDEFPAFLAANCHIPGPSDAPSRPSRAAVRPR
jgi:hypothetical protein